MDAVAGRRRVRRLAVVTLGALTVALATASQPAAAQTPEAASMVVTPSTDLFDGHIVVVEGSGFPPNTDLIVAQCPASTFVEGCQGLDLTDGFVGVVTTDAAGEFSGSDTAQAVLEDVTGATQDCRPGGEACAIVARALEEDDQSALASTPITFDPDAPLEPAPSLTVTPSTGLVDGQHVIFDGAGFSPDAFANLWHCRGVAAVRDSCSLMFIEPFRVNDAGGTHRGFDISAMIGGVGGTGIDCRMTMCSLVMGDGSNWAVAEVQFAEAAAAEPIPQAPAFTG